MSNKKFGDLTREEQLKLFEAWLDDKQSIEKRVGSDPNVYGWEGDTYPTWYKNATYRIKETPDTINWDHVHPDYKWMARDGDGDVGLFKVKPTLDYARHSGFARPYWWGSMRDYTNACGHLSYKRGTVSAENSLVKRPE